MITSPLDISGGNCAVWLDATNTTTLSSLSGGAGNSLINTSLTGDFVGGWGDKSGNGRNFTNIGGSATTRPTWISSLSTVRFDGTDDFLSSIFSLNFNNQTVFLVGAVLSYISQGRIYAQVDVAGTQDTGSSNFIPFTQTTSTNTIGTNVDSATTRSSINLRSLSSYDIFSHVRSSGVLQNFIDGVAGTSYASVNTTYTTYASRLGMGFATGFGSTFLPSRIDISEVIVYDKALSNAERADVEYYLTKKWSFLNSIPRQVYAIQNGNWSNSTTWSVSAEPSPWNLPLSADNVYSNTFTVTADSSTRVSTVQNTALSPTITAGGSFILSNGISLSATVPLAAHTSPWLLTLVPAATAIFNGSINGTTLATNPVVFIPGNTTLTILGSAYNGTTPSLSGNIVNNGIVNIFGNVRSINGNQGSNINSTILNNNNVANIIGDVVGTTYGNNPGSAAILCRTSSTTSITGNIGITYANFANHTLVFSGVNNATLNIKGNVSILYPTSVDPNSIINVPGNAGCIGLTNAAANNTINIIGDIGSQGIYSVNTGTNRVNISGNIIPGYYGPGIAVGNGTLNATLTGSVYAAVAGFGSSNVTYATSNGIVGNVNLSAWNCNIINAPNGRQAINAPSIRMFPGTSATYTRHAVNGYDSYVDYWTSDATFTYPASSDVVSNTTYNNKVLTGTMVLPSPSSVFLNCPVGSTATTIFQITTGNRYLITSNPLNTNFVLAGASSNTPGTIFAATSTVSFSTPITAYNSDTGRVVPLGTSTPPTVDSFWNKALSELTLPSNTIGDKLKNVVTTQQLSSIYTGLIYTAPGSF